LAQEVIFFLLVRQVTSLYLSQNNDSPIHGFTYSPQARVGTLPKNRPQLLPFTSYQTDYLLSSSHMKLYSIVR
jgi:hypothetical protein